MLSNTVIIFIEKERERKTEGGEGATKVKRQSSPLTFFKSV